MSESKPIKQSRWVKKSKIERYDKRALEYIYDRFHEAAGWLHGARVRDTFAKRQAQRIDT